MARNDPADDYGRALDVGLISSDHLHRALLRNDLVLERARLAARQRDAGRLRAKYARADVDARADAAIRAQAARVTAAHDAAARTYVERVDVPADAAVVHGIVRAGKPGDLEMVALGAGDKPVGRTRTDARGYFKLVIGADAAAAAARGSRLPVVEASSTPAAATTPTATIRLVVRRGDHEVFRDAQGIDVRPGRVRYRELGLEER